MKIILGALALAVAVPAAAQTVPATDPHAGHAGHTTAPPPAPADAPTHDHHGMKMDCCKDEAAKKDCCKEMAAKKEGCCADQPAR